MVTKTEEALERQVTGWRMGRLKFRTVFTLAAIDSNVAKLPHQTNPQRILLLAVRAVA